MNVIRYAYLTGQ